MVEEYIEPKYKTTDVMMSINPFEPEVVIVDLTMASQSECPSRLQNMEQIGSSDVVAQQTGCDSAMSLSSSSLGDSDSVSGLNDKTWVDADDDITSDSDCVVIEHLQSRKKCASKVKKNTLKEQRRDDRGKFTSENCKKTLLNLRTPRNIAKRAAATINFKRYQLSPTTTSSRADLPMGMHTTGIVSPLNSASMKKCNIERTHEPAKKKVKVSNCQHQNVVNTRSVTRRLGSEGCVLEPPTPEDALELREWPTEGMHERPVWPDPRYEVPESSPLPASDLEVAVHHSLHSALAFVAQVGRSAVYDLKSYSNKFINISADCESKMPYDNSLPVELQTNRVSFINNKEKSTSYIQQKIVNVQTYKNTDFGANRLEVDKLEHKVISLRNLLIEENPNVETYKVCGENDKDSSDSTMEQKLENPEKCRTRNIYLDNQMTKLFTESKIHSEVRNIVTNIMSSEDHTWQCKRSEMIRAVPSYGIFTEPLRIKEKESSSLTNFEQFSNNNSVVTANLPKNMYDCTTKPSGELSSDDLACLEYNSTYNFENVVVDNCETFSKMLPEGAPEINSMDCLSSENMSTIEYSDGVLNKSTTTSDEMDEQHNLINLILNTGILYCAVCSVSQKALAEYIDSMSVDSALQWFREIEETK